MTIVRAGKEGWFTLIGGPTYLRSLEISDKDVKLVRLLGGYLTDHEGFAEEMVKNHNGDKDKKFVQFKTHRLLVQPRLCECQYTGWKGGNGET